MSKETLSANQASDTKSFKDPSALSKGEEMKQYRDVLIKLVGLSPLNLRPIIESCPQYASDEDFLLSAASNSILALLYASDDLKKDKDFVEQICAVNGACIKYASPLLREDKQFIFKIMESSDKVFEQCPESIQSDTSIVLAAINTNQKYGWDTIDHSLRNNDDVAIALIEKNLLPFSFLSDRMKDDMEMAKRAFRIGTHNFSSVSDRLKKDKDFLLFVVDTNPHFIEFIVRKDIPFFNDLVAQFVRSSAEFPDGIIKRVLPDTPDIRKVIHDELSKKSQEFFTGRIAYLDDKNIEADEDAYKDNYAIDILIEHLHDENLDMEVQSKAFKTLLANEVHRRKINVLQKASLPPKEKKRKSLPF